MRADMVLAKRSLGAKDPLTVRAGKSHCETLHKAQNEWDQCVYHQVSLRSRETLGVVRFGGSRTGKFHSRRHIVPVNFII
jgi:hypothetical protein